MKDPRTDQPLYEYACHEGNYSLRNILRNARLEENAGDADQPANSGGDWEYGWWLIEKSSDLFHIPRAFATFYAYERSVQWPDGHRNVFHTRRGVPVVSYFTRSDFVYPRPGIGAQSEDLVENDIPLLYESLRRTGGISIPHSPGSNMGTDWRYNDQDLEPVVEIFQGHRISYEHPGAPRAARSAEDNPLGGWQESGLVWSAYRKGYRIGTIASSDHWSTHISYAMVYAEEATRAVDLRGHQETPHLRSH